MSKAKGTYAVTTTVSVSRSQSEIQEVLEKYGAERFGIMNEKNSGFVMFQYNNMKIQITVNYPSKDDFKHTDQGRLRVASAVKTQYEQARKQRWRAMLLAITAKLELIEIGSSTIEQEFMAFVKMPDGISFGDKAIPLLQEMTKTGKVPLIGMK
jgi:hypothetical protein